jgi:response regulator of citrate/malate metabolism
MKEQKEFGSVNLDFGRTGTLKGVSRKRLIQYNPKLSIEKIAKKNGVSEAVVQAYIRDNHIDRKRDNQLILYKKVKKMQHENPELTAVEISKKLNCAYNTIKRYMNMDKFDVPVKKGHISLVHNDTDK